MLIDSVEYKKLRETEDKLWWFKHLHNKVLKEIKNNSLSNTISILDAGCGTGGLLEKLKSEGYENVIGFDFSEDAVDFSRERGFNVTKLDILNCADHFEESQFDIIISNDVWYQFDDNELDQLLNNLFKILKPGGIIISNNQALKAFGGIHDIAVGAKRRFKKSDFKNNTIINKNAKFVKMIYWSFILAPLIYIIRLSQRIKLRLFKSDIKIESDVKLPSPVINSIFFKIVDFEENLPVKSPFGSSLFLVMKKT